MLLQFLNLFLYIFIHSDNFSFSALPIISSIKNTKSVINSYVSTQEGFLSGTLVKTDVGYQLIDELRIGDSICGPNGLQEILYIKKIESHSYFIIKICQDYVKTGSEQLFHLMDGSLKKIVDLQIFDQLQNGLFIDEIIQIDEPSSYYLLSVQHQSFYVYPNLLVHNFDPLVMGAASFTLGIIEFINPVVLLAGGLYALHLYATNYFRTKVACEFEFDDEDPDLTVENLSLYNLQTIQEARFYYSSKRQELVDMYQKLVQVQTGVFDLMRAKNIYPASYAYNFMSLVSMAQYQQLFLPSIEYEYKLSLAQKIQLLKVRDEDLEKIQKDIFDIHFCIVFYINEIIERRDIAYKEYDQFSDDFTLVANKWNSYAPQIPYSIALENYSIHLTWQDVLENLKIKTEEVQFFLIYYQFLANNCLINKTMNLQNILIEQLAINKDIFENIKDSRARWHLNMIEIENYLRNNNWLSQQLINNLKNKVREQRAIKEKDLLFLAKNKKHAASNVTQNNSKKQSSIQTPNIKGPDKDPDDDWFEKLKKVAKRKALHRKFKKFYKDPQTDLWWSKDNGSSHAGPHYKVFQERATYLEWIRDIDLLGKVMEKHKGPIGQIIPFKELIFY
jgi:hypothetical protein